MTRRYTIIVRGPIALVNPRLPPSAEADLVLPRRTIRVDSTGRVDCIPAADRLYRHVDGGTLVPAGLVPRLAARLRRRGHEVDIQDRKAVRQIGDQPISGLYAADVEFLEALRRHQRGQIRVRDARTRLRWIELACCDADARTLVVASTRDEVERMYHRLGRWTCAVPILREPRWDLRAQIVVVTPYILASAQPIEWQQIIFPDIRSALAGYSLESAVRFERVYAFLLVDQRIQRSAELALETVCGPEIHRQSIGRSQPATVSVVGLAGAPWMPVGQGLTALAQKRVKWRDHTRNQLVASAAQAYAAGDVDLQTRLGVAVSGQRSSPASVSVLVESPEHARAIGKLLPGWHIVDATAASAVRKAVPFGRQHAYAIMTYVAASKLGIVSDVVIRADTQPGWPLPERRFPRPWGQSNTVLLVDIDGGFDPRRRQQDYRSRGWIPGPEVVRPT